ncbi:hypothetical protein EUX98_g1714 [Antrodiella citrinella]|uniref:Ketoreductase (KR) domain-containing protein n=1 Tax=Antrodiella citrinella TaxID=2447956 RepID=A0A4S4N0Q4_9APHY|nr:hypothetical protein EUX98_g1714 [Antrodiella citrinella]
MVLAAAYTLSTRVLPPKYYPHAAVVAATGVIAYAFAQGRMTNRERDLHTRTILVTGGFTPLGLTLITSLAARGAHIIALSEYPITDNSLASLLIPVLRTATNNEEIYAEHAELSSPESIRKFCSQFLTGEDHRLDGIVFAHEYRTIGSVLRRETKEASARRDMASLATFLIVTLLLPKLLVAPIERDIRIVTIVNPFYAASAPLFPAKLTSILTATNATKKAPLDPLFVAEGYRALRTTIFTRHLQRILNALPNGAPAPDASKNKSQPPVVKPPLTSNIIAVSAAPGVARADTMSPLLAADRQSGPEYFSLIGLLLYILMYPFLWIFTKPSKTAEQTVLHTLFLPTPFKRALAQVDAATDTASAFSPSKEKQESPEDFLPEEVLKPGALYRECAVVNLRVPSLPHPPEKQEDQKAKDAKKKAKKGKGKEEEEIVVLEDDGELGGESLGRMVWEWYETRLKDWETNERAQLDAMKKAEMKDDSSAPNLSPTSTSS